MEWSEELKITLSNFARQSCQNQFLLKSWWRSLFVLYHLSTWCKKQNKQNKKKNCTVVQVFWWQSKDPALWRRARAAVGVRWWWWRRWGVGSIGYTRRFYLILLGVLHQWGLPAEAGALGGALVLPPDWATWFVSDTLNLNGTRAPPPGGWRRH